MQLIDLSGNFDFSETYFGDIITYIFAKMLHASLEITFRNIEHTYYLFKPFRFNYEMHLMVKRENANIMKYVDKLVVGVGHE